MTSDDAQLDQWYRNVVVACWTIEGCRMRIRDAAQIPGTEQSRYLELGSTWSYLVNAALRFCELYDQRPAHRPPTRELYEADLRYGLTSGTFVEMFREQPSDRWISARHNLEIAKQQLDAAQRTNNPSVLDELANIDFGPAIFRICCATVAGALIGAPLGALAIHESVPLKMTEAAFTTGAAAVLAEVYQPLSGRLSRDKPPAEPVTNLDIVYSDVDNVTRPGSLLNDLEPLLLPKPPDNEPSQQPRGPGWL